MARLTKLIAIVLVSICGLLYGQSSWAQSVLDPNDPVVTYNSATPPTKPAPGVPGKWVRTKRLNWNTDPYKAYIFKDIAFRLKFPTSYNPTAADGKKYPMIVMFHGRGEAGPITDNEYQLLHGGRPHMDAVTKGVFDGYVIFMQNTGGSWGDYAYDVLRDLIEYMVVNNKLDRFRVNVHGLSMGGQGTWEMTRRHPTYIASLLPMSNTSIGYKDDATMKNNLKFTPLWQFQGGLDGNPAPSTSQQVRDAFLAVGSNYRYTEYPNLAHGTWNTAYAEKDFFPFMLRAHKANPWPLFGRAEFCTGDVININIGVTPGFDQYEWRKDGVPLSATGNVINVREVGTYECRVRKGTEWSPWSPTPLVVRVKPPTVSPDITVSGIASNVLPSPDGKSTVTLEVPEGYASYLWQRVGSTTTLSTTRLLTGATPGQYRVKVTEQFGCSSDFSNAFTVIDADGPNKPDAAINTIVSTVSKTALRLDWSDNPAPVYNETGFEIYRATQAGGPYTMIHLTGPDVLTYTDNNLNSGSTYYYIIRAVNNSGAATPTSEKSATTDKDEQAPTAPRELVVAGASRNSISIAWQAASDDVGVTKYDIYINGQKAYVVPNTQLSFTAYNLEYGKTYTFTVRARDFANNVSPFSNQVSSQAKLSGLGYKYYHGIWDKVPDFNALTPVKVGNTPNVSLAPATQTDYFGFLWEGYINIPVGGTYTFRTRSDDGSKLYIGPFNHTATALVNNDGLHGAQNRDGTITLTAGIHPISIAYFEKTGTSTVMELWWRTPQTGTSFVRIPDNAFAEAIPMEGTAPAAPGNLTATATSFNKVQLNWSDNSTNETAFEVYRSSMTNTGFTVVGTAPANATSFVDELVDPSTTYYYKIKAVGQYGESARVPSYDAQAIWKFDNNYSDGSGNNKALTQSNAPAFVTNEKKEGTHSILLNGSNEHVNIVTSSNDYLKGAYNQKTIAFWMKASQFTNNRVIVDIGGHENGLALRLNTSQLQAGVASSTTLRANLATPYTSTAWNHVALVYNQNSLKLFLNGVQVAANNALSFTTIKATSNNSRIGITDGSNAFNSSSTSRYAGHLDDFRIYGSALSADQIQQLMNGTYEVVVRTPSLPAAPAAPTTLVAAPASTSAINVNWADNAGNEDEYELYRSSNNNSNYVLLSKLPANTNSFQDTGLFANATYFYRVRAVNAGGYSAYSNEDDAQTGNNQPSINSITDQKMRFGTELQVSVQASDVDPGTLTLQASNLPAFASFTNSSNGQGTLTFSPATADQGTYTGITLTVTDQHGGTSNTTFTLVVNDNHVPTLGSVGNVTLNEKQTQGVTISAADQNTGDELVWNFNGLPAFASATTSNTGAQLSLAPGLADHGVYPVTVSVEDGNGGQASQSFTITVNNVDPNKKVFINFTDGALQSPAPWNNTNKVPALNDNFANLKDQSGATTSIGLQITSSWQDLGNGTNTLGVNTGNNSGVYPDNVIRSAYFTDSRTQSIRIYGLDLNSKHNITFFGSRGSVSDNRTTTYTIGGQSVSLNAAGNSMNTVTISDVVPSSDGSVSVTIQRASGASYGYLNALVVESLFDDGSAPAKPRSLTAEVAGSQIQLNWIDAAYNETAYEVYRATEAAGPFTLLNPGGNNAGLETYTDGNIIGNTTYYYYVRAINAAGATNSDVLSIVTPNTAPQLNDINDVNMRVNQVVTININAVDEPGDVVTLSVAGLPSFATFTDNGNGSGTIQIAPGEQTGVFENVTITAKDQKGATVTRTFKIIVTVNGLRSYLVNFNQVLPVGQPWNSMNSAPLAGTTLSDLKDEHNTASTIDVQLIDRWENANDVGGTTGNNSGVYPDDVMKTAYYESATTAKRIRISGLTVAPDIKYNLIFFGSRGGVPTTENRSAVYSANGKSVTLNASSNTSNTVKLTDLSPNASGEIEFTVVKASGASYAYLNALVIQSYEDVGPVLLAPASFMAAGKTNTSIQLSWTNKTDNQTAVEIYRSTSLDGTYTLLATVGGNATSYVNTGLAANTQYYYKVRGMVSGQPTPFSAIASASTISYEVFVNFNQVDPAGSPWNNTNNVPQDGSVFSNLKNGLENPTGINMTVVGGAFNGVNPFGSVTGNNTGVYPDNVIKSTWWLDRGSVATLKIDGLSQAQAYNFIFFASRDGSGYWADRTTTYSIGTRSVSLNAINNVSQTVQINNIRADEDGAVYIDIQAGGQSPYAYIGALVIQSYNSSEDGSQAAPEVDGSVTLSGVQTDAQSEVAPSAPRRLGVDLMEGPVTVSAYPNPFVDDVTVQIALEKPVSKATILVVDASGKTVATKILNNVPQGLSQHALGLNRRQLAKGAYFVQISGLDGNRVRTIKLLKR